MQLPLSTSVSATFATDGHGNSVARAYAGPQIFGTKWNIDRVLTLTNSDQLQFGWAQLKIYRGSETQSNYFDGTSSADQDTNELSGLELVPGETLLFVWTGGNIGTVATAIITGTMDTGR